MMKVFAKVHPVTQKEGSDSKVLAFATLELGGALKVSDVAIVQGQKGPFVAMPSYKTKDGEYKEFCHPVTKEFRETLNKTILDAYGRDTKWAVHNGDESPSVEVNVSKFEKDGIKAIGSFTLGKEFMVNNVTVRENTNGNLFVTMPSTSYDKNGEKVYKDICSPAGDYATKGTIVGRIINATKEKLAQKEPLEAQVASAEETKKAQTEKADKKPSRGKAKKTEEIRE